MKKLATIFISLVWLSATLANAADSRPNIIVFYSDDHGHADLSCQGVLNDIKTPNVAALAKNGVLARHGYSTAPQCVPSRAGLMIGKFQSKFGVEANGKNLGGFDRELTIAERRQDAGYITAQFGKWHLGSGSKITEHGFKHVFNQHTGRPFAANITLDGQDREMSNLPPELYHVDGCSKAAASLIKRYKDDPFFLYVAYRAPHVPLDAPQKYLDRFPGEMPERRRQALAMLSAVDDGVGLIADTLAQHDLTGEKNDAPHEFLAWRWTAQSAIREGNWKLLRGGEREYLYDLKSDLEQKHNVAAENPEIADRLREKLSRWASELDPPGLAIGDMSRPATAYFDFYLDGKPPAPPRTKVKPTPESTTSASTKSAVSGLPWVIRNGAMKQTEEGLQISPQKSGKKQRPLIARNGLSLTGPVSASVVAKTATSGAIGFSWRTSADQGFAAANRVSVAVENSDDWQTLETMLPVGKKIVHVRIQVPDGITSIKSIELKPASGKTVTLAD